MRHGRFTLPSALALAAVVTGLVLFPRALRAQDDTATIVVHAGGIRSGNTSTVGRIPDGAVFTAQAFDNANLRFTCMTSGGNCTITGLPGGHQWQVRETTAPGGFYLNPQLATGGQFTTGPRNYAFRTAILAADTTTDVPSANPNTIVLDGNGQRFTQLATSLNDPPPVTRCGLNIALVLDQSGSMVPLQEAMKTAARNTVADLTGTSSTIAIFTFASSTGPSIGKTSTLTAASAAPLIDFINALPTPVGGTNTDQGLGQAINQGFDLIILLTDGNPTFNRLGGTGGRTDFSDIEQSIFSANAIKSGGARIVGIGIGLAAVGGTTNLRAVSGPVENQDFFSAESDTFGAILRQEATGNCGNQLEITKQIQDATGILISPAPTDANGWTFSNTISNGSTIESPVTTGPVNGTNGIASAAVTITGESATVTVTETPKAGFTFVGAQCSVGGTNVATNVNGNTATFTAPGGQPLACTFTNRQERVVPPIAITHFPSGGGRVGTTISDTAIVTGGNRPTGTVTFRLFGPNETDCDETQAQFVVFTSTNTLTGGTATSGHFTTNAAGTFHWLATYNGDANNPVVSSACTAVTIVAR